MNEAVLAKGTLVYVTSAGPYSGRKGMIRTVDLIGEERPALVVFYLVSLLDESNTELWLEHDAVAVVRGSIQAIRSDLMKAR